MSDSRCQSPFRTCHVEVRDAQVTIRQPDEWIALGLRALKEHDLAFQLEGRIIEAPGVTSRWLPYNYEAIMRYGNSVNSDIPADPAEAEFRPLPWPERVIIRMKSAATPPDPSAPLPAWDSSPAPGLPKSWADVTLGHAPQIIDASSGRVGCRSTHQVRAAIDEHEEPIAEELADYRV